MILGRDEAAIECTSISEQVYFHIKRMILSGELSGGMRVPEKKIADHFKVSRTPVREAIMKLAEYGLIIIKPRSYAFVATISPKEAHDITQVRLSLEKLSFKLFQPLATPEKLAELADIAKRCAAANAAGDTAGAHEFDSFLHLQIARGTENAELYKMLKMLDAKLQLLRLKQRLPADVLSKYFNQHETLVQKLAAGDYASLEKMLDDHILHHLDFMA